MHRILIVDDEPGIRSLLALAFRRAGYDVTTAAHAFKALQLLESDRFDALLSDIDLPHMDGHCLVRLVAEKYPLTRSVLMSAHGSRCDECPFASGCKLLQKPFLPVLAVAAISDALAGQPD